MRVLVTGATGFVGSHAAAALRRAGHDVRLLVRSREKARDILRHHFVGPRRESRAPAPSSPGDPAAIAPGVPGEPIDDADIVVGDVTSPATVAAALTGCDAVVHAAAITPMHLRPGQDLEAVNVGGVRAVVGGACERGLSTILYVSSVTAIFHTEPTRMTADAPVVPSHHPYGRSKADAELYVRALQDRGAPVKTVYPGGILGPDDPGLSAASYALLHRLRRKFLITSGGAQQIDVRDLAAAIVALLDAAPGAGRFLTVGHFLSWKEIATLLERISGCRLNKTTVPGLTLRTAGWLLDVVRRFRPVASPISAENMRYATQWPAIRNSPELERLGVRFRPPADTFRDTLRWMCAAGHLERSVVPGLDG